MKWILPVLLLAIVCAGCTVTDQDGNRINIVGSEQGLAAKVDMSSTTSLKAVLKGSIYASGETITLYGACLDANDVSLGGSVALLTSWYPNGTQELVNVSMTGVNSTPGYFMYIGPMSSTQGTYLTQLDCYYGSQTAKAFGEWQNPGWTNHLMSLNLTPIQLSLVSISQQLNETYINLSTEMGSQFNHTWSYINYSLTNITWQLDNLNATNAAQLQTISVNTQMILDLMNALCTGSPDPYVIISFNITTQCSRMDQIQQQLNAIQATLSNITGVVIQNNALLWNLTYQMWNVSAQITNISQQIDIVINETQGLNTAITSVNNTVLLTANQTYQLLGLLNSTLVTNTENLTTLLYYVAGVANGSVDRNDSYLAILLRGVAVATGAPITGYLNTTVVSDSPVYYKVNRVEALVINEYGQKAAPPLVQCFFSSNTNPATVNATMDYETTSSNSDLNFNGAKVHGGFYYYGEKVTVRGDYIYNVTCRYNAAI